MIAYRREAMSTRKRWLKPCALMYQREKLVEIQQLFLLLFFLLLLAQKITPACSACRDFAALIELDWNFLCLNLLSAAGLDQQGYATDRLPDLPLPRSARRQPTRHEAQDIQRLLRQMLAFEQAQRPSISSVVPAFENFARQFPMNWLRSDSLPPSRSLSCF